MKLNSVKSLFKVCVLSLIIICTSCNQESFNDKVAINPVDVSEEYESISNISDTIGSGSISKPLSSKNLKIIKSASVRYKVKEVKKATKRVKQIAEKYDAYLSDLRFQNDLYKIENRFTIKIPFQYFDVMMDSIAQVAEFIEYENITTKDVTEEYTDIKARLKTKIEVKDRYETILRKNAKTVEDILATEERLRLIQEEIESAQGRLKYLTNKVSYSTIQVDLYETTDYKEEPVSYKKTFWSKSKNGLAFGWDIIETIVLGVLHIWPLIILGIIVFFFIKRRSSKK